jgi:glucuronate isomerase
VSLSGILPPHAAEQNQAMNDSVRETIYQAIASIRLIDPHTHINPHAPASSTLADLLGYHYYTELAHSAGMPKAAIEEEGIGPRELVRRLVSNLSPIENTAQYRWLVEICRKFFGFDGERIDSSNWEGVYDAAEQRMAAADWSQTVLDQSNIEAVFLTNDFDDPLAGFDTDTYIPCLRTDDLVFHLAKEPIRGRLASCSGIELNGSLSSLRHSLEQRFEHFVSRGARACAISLPPSFEPTPISDGRAATALDAVLQRGELADASHRAALSRRVFWTLAELCDHFGLPFDLMIGVNRGVYAGGVYQGQDLYDSRVSLIQYRELFNAFSDVRFPISVLASVTNQELVSYAWIFPNVITNGHWWYSNTPSFIARDAAARLEAVPRTKQIAYYSDAYKLEFVWPKFDMYRRILAGILADHFVGQCDWSEERAIELGQQVLRDNVEAIFPKPAVGGPSAAREAEAPDEALAVTPSDPLPSDEEIESLEMRDVELRDLSSEPAAIDRDSMEQQLDEEPLDVGDLLSDEQEGAPSIRMLRGEESFSADEESLRLQPHPITGELMFQSSEEPSSSDAEDLELNLEDDSTAAEPGQAVDDPLVFEEVEEIEFDSTDQDEEDPDRQ